MLADESEYAVLDMRVYREVNSVTVIEENVRHTPIAIFRKNIDKEAIEQRVPMMNSDTCMYYICK